MGWIRRKPGGFLSEGVWGGIKVNFKIIFLYEFKKIIKSKLTIAAVLLAVLIVMYTSLDIGGNSKGVVESMKGINGRVIDDTLLQEMYSSIDDYGSEWTTDNMKYKGLASFEQGVVGHEVLSNYSADDIYELRSGTPHDAYDKGTITKGELKWWESEENIVKTPFTYFYHGDMFLLASVIGYICLLLLLVSSISLSSVFSGERKNRTDQIILCTKNGKRVIFGAKILAGVTFLISLYIVLMIIAFMVVAITKGLDGWKACVQLSFPYAAYPYTFGEYICIQLIILLFVSVLFAVLAMVCSQLFGKTVAVTGFMMGLFFFSGIITFPDSFRIPQHILSLFPTELTTIFSLYSFRLIGFGTHYLSDYQAAPIIYIAISLLILYFGYRSYQCYQIKGR